jgi:PAS domain S-box-containing protein
VTDSYRPSEPGHGPDPDRLQALEAENAQLRAALAGMRETTRRLAQVRLVADSLPVLISYIDADCRYRFNNRAYEDWFGISRDAVAGLHMREVLGEAAFEQLRPMIDRALAGEQVSFDRELPYRTGTRHVHIDYVPDRSASGTIAGFFVLVEDISERERVARELRESEARFRSIADCTPAPMWVTNAEGIEFANQAFAEVAGRPVDRLTGAADRATDAAAADQRAA